MKFRVKEHKIHTSNGDKVRSMLLQSFPIAILWGVFVIGNNHKITS